MVDRVEISIIEESQPRWLSFLNGQHDMLEGIPPEFAQIVIPNGKLAPNLEKSGIQMDRIPLIDIVVTYFNMDDPVVGGYTPEKVALRRALSPVLQPRAGDPDDPREPDDPGLLAGAATDFRLRPGVR